MLYSYLGISNQDNNVTAYHMLYSYLGISNQDEQELM